ncbi:MAG TPA: YafY family protein [Blastocatellia bacterium]|nr:YafY family protein [Blastocatellia bacterium]
MRADRLISILLLLQIHRRLTSHELAERLEVSERTIHRDMEALGIAGIPVVSERGAGGGWTLMEGYRTNLTGLSEAETRALFLTRPARLLADLGLEKASEAGLIKLQASLPLPHQRDAEFARRRIHVDVTGWNNAKEAVPMLPSLFEAVWHERRLKFTYQRGDDSTVERLADPLGLVAKGSAWYLVACVDGEIRSYRVSRIKEAALTDQPCLRPESFDLAAHWEQSSVEFREKLPRYEVVVRARQEIVWRLRYAGRFMRIAQVDAPDADGWALVSLVFQMEDEACECLVGLGTNVEILEPPELREKVVSLAESVIAFYARKGPVLTE